MKKGSSGPSDKRREGPVDCCVKEETVKLLCERRHGLLKKDVKEDMVC